MVFFSLVKLDFSLIMKKALQIIALHGTFRIR